MTKYKKILLLASFLSVIYGGFIFYIISPKAEESYFENRTLAKVPDFTQKKFFSGEYSKEYETYFADHFPKRDYFVKLYKQYELATPKTFVGEYHVTKDDWILKITSPFNQSIVVESAEKVNEFAKVLKEENLELTYIALPEKMNAISLELPEYVEQHFGKEKKALFLKTLSSDVEVIDVGAMLKEKYSPSEIDSMYFKTDHHWNAFGAFVAYREIVNQLDVDKNGISENYEKTCPVDGAKFFGSWNKQLSGLVDSKTEDACIYLPNDETTDFTVNSRIYKTLDFKDDTPSSIWSKMYGIGINEKLERLDYGKLFTTDMPIIKVVNDKNEDGMNVLIIKDSYANPLYPHLSNHFRETTVFDVRHNEKGELLDLIKGQRFDKVIIMYNDSIRTGTKILDINRYNEKGELFDLIKGQPFDKYIIRYRDSITTGMYEFE